MSEIEIIIKKVEDLIPYNGSHDFSGVVSSLEESITKFGFQQPIIIDSSNNVIAGNALLQAAKNIGMTDIPCKVEHDLTDEQINQYRIADNKTAEFASWNEGKLKKELSYLSSPSELQFCFDEDISSMLGMDNPVMRKLKNDTDEALAEKKKEQDRKTKEMLRQFEKRDIVHNAEFYTHTCSGCGQKYKFKLK